jgi:hypothetical protein
MITQEIFQNTFFRSIFIPIILTCASALLEIISMLVKGKSNGGNRYRVWVQQDQPDGTKFTIAIPHQSIDQISGRSGIVEIEQMVNLDVTDFKALGINLMLGAFSVNIASLVGNPTTTNPRMTGFVLFGQLLLLVGVLLFTILCYLVPPENNSLRKRYISASILLGLIAMMISFFSI